MSTIKHLMAYLLVIAFCFSCQDDDSDFNDNDTPTSSIEKNIFELVNKHRKSKNLPPLLFSKYASELSVEHNNYMISRGRISHDKFNSRYQKLRSKVKAITAAENVANGHKDATSVMEGWLRSSGHRRNIEGNFTHIGISAKKDSKGNYYYTQIFYSIKKNNKANNTNNKNIEKNILVLVNKHRKSKNLPPLQFSQYASQLSLEHNNYMISKGRISHDKFNNRYQKLRSKVKAVIAAENVANGHKDAASVMKGWLKSSRHRKNIEGNFTHIGISAKKDNRGNYYYTQIFYSIKKITKGNDTNNKNIEKNILALVNKHRKSKNLPPLQFSQYASQLSVEHNNYMISKGQISHDNFNSRYQKLRSKVKAVTAAENVANGYKDAASVMKGWLNSSGHRKNIEGNFTHIGISAKKDSKGNYYYTQIFYSIKKITKDDGGDKTKTIEKQILQLVNKHRASKNLRPFKFSQYASQLCAEHNNYMISKGQISHDNFNGRYQKLQSKVNAMTAAENVANGYRDAASVMKGWLNSPGHRKNIEGNFTYIGIHAKKDSRGKYYYTQLFYR